MSNSEPIRLTYGEFWRELHDLREDGRLSSQMTLCLQRLIASHGRSVHPPEASEYLSDLFKWRLSGGIILSDNRKTIHYDIRVKNSSFKLVRRRETEKHLPTI